MERRILYYKNYFIDFFRSLDVGAQRKIAYVIDVLKTQQRPGTNFVKHIRRGFLNYGRSIMEIFIGHFSFLTKGIL